MFIVLALEGVFKIEFGRGYKEGRDEAIVSWP